MRHPCEQGAASAQSTVSVRLSCLPLGAFLGRAWAIAVVFARASGRAPPVSRSHAVDPTDALSSRLDPDKVSGGAEGCGETGMVRQPPTQ